MSIKIKGFEISLTQLIMLGLLLVGLAVGVYLIQVKQVFKSQAAVDLNQALEIKDASGNLITCSFYTCYTDSSEVYIRVKDVDLLEKNFVSPR